MSHNKSQKKAQTEDTKQASRYGTNFEMIRQRV